MIYLHEKLLALEREYTLPPPVSAALREAARFIRAALTVPGIERASIEDDIPPPKETP